MNSKFTKLMRQAAIVGSIPTHRNHMSPVAQSDRALNNETCKSLKQQVSNWSVKPEVTGSSPVRRL